MPALAAAFLAVSAASALAQDPMADPFSDVRNGGKLHTPSGYVCPARIGLFERDAVGQSDVAAGTDFCAYSALDGVYGTIRLTPLQGPYDARSSLAPGFVEQEETGGRRISEVVVKLPLGAGLAPVALYTRTYETARLEDLHYRVLFTGARFQNWAVETTIEYAEPRDTPVEDQFLHAVYAAAESELVRGRPAGP